MPKGHVLGRVRKGVSTWAGGWQLGSNFSVLGAEPGPEAGKPKLELNPVTWCLVPLPSELLVSQLSLPPLDRDEHVCCPGAGQSPSSAGEVCVIVDGTHVSAAQHTLTYL